MDLRLRGPSGDCKRLVPEGSEGEGTGDEG